MLEAVQIIRGSGNRGVRFEKVDIQHPRLSAVLPKKVRSLLGKEGRFDGEIPAERIRFVWPVAKSKRYKVIFKQE